jgi:hypothetical protein
LPPGTDNPLKRLDASTTTGFCKLRRRREMLFTVTAVTAGNVKFQVIESKHVINRELWVALQFPIGDDVSACIRCAAAQGSCCRDAMASTTGSTRAPSISGYETAQENTTAPAYCAATVAQYARRVGGAKALLPDGRSIGQGGKTGGSFLAAVSHSLPTRL